MQTQQQQQHEKKHTDLNKDILTPTHSLRVDCRTNKTIRQDCAPPTPPPPPAFRSLNPLLFIIERIQSIGIGSTQRTGRGLGGFFIRSRWFFILDCDSSARLFVSFIFSRHKHTASIRRVSTTTTTTSAVSLAASILFTARVPPPGRNSSVSLEQT